VNRTPVAQKIRAGIDKWDCIRLKSFCTSEETITRMKRKSTFREEKKKTLHKRSFPNIGENNSTPSVSRRFGLHTTAIATHTNQKG
jgi:hypothetical protein